MEGPKALLGIQLGKAIGWIPSYNIRPHSYNISPSSVSKCLFQALAGIYNLAIILNTCAEIIWACLASIVIKIQTDKVLKYWVYSLGCPFYKIHTTWSDHSVHSST